MQDGELHRTDKRLMLTQPSMLHFRIYPVGCDTREPEDGETLRAEADRQLPTHFRRCLEETAAEAVAPLATSPGGQCTVVDVETASDGGP